MVEVVDEVEVEALQLIVRVLMESPVYPLLSSHWVIESQSKKLYLVWTKADCPFHASLFRCWNFRTRGKFILMLKLWHTPICGPEKVLSDPVSKSWMVGVVQFFFSWEIVILRQSLHFEFFIVSVMSPISLIRSSARRKL